MSGALPLLPPLREDLRLHEATPDSDGSPAWSIQDPVTNRFFRIGWLEFECLLRWQGTAENVAQGIAKSTPLDADAAQIEMFARFLERHQLVRPRPEAVTKMAAESGRRGWTQWRWWLHHYLFIRIPLIHPDRLFSATLPFVRPLVSPTGLVSIVLASLLGIALVLRQWDTFTHSVVESLTPAGLTGFLLALAISKTCHELGHAMVATRFGVRVSHMGVALVVLWPMLYTDTSETWKLRSHRQRLAVSSAGIVVEMALAGLATLAWATLDDGPLRQAMLYLATTGWVLTLALNASPFMRFDGYFILSDLLDFPNLHERAGALAKAWLRRNLLGWNEPDPEQLPSSFRRALISFALTTWVYRLVVFLGIAVAVYLFFFKALGIFLFCVEVIWFIVMPVRSEMSIWSVRWSEVKANRRVGLSALVMFFFAIAAFPWAFEISAPGVAQAERRQTVFASFPARMANIHPYGPVKAGSVLAAFDSPDHTTREMRTLANVESLNQRLKGLEAEDSGIDQRRVTTERIGEQLAESRANMDEVARLRMTAEFDGVWLDLDPAIKSGTWVNTKTQVGVLIAPGKWIVDAYVDEHQVERLRPGARASFRPHGQWSPIDSSVLEVDTVRTSKLSHPMLDASHGGPIATQPGDKQSVPVKTYFRVRLALSEPPPNSRETLGQARIEGAPQSLLMNAAKHVIALIIRESGF